MGNPEVSAVVPAFNEEASVPRLHEALSATLRACCKSYELIFVDDGSTDGTARVLDALAARDQQVRVLHFSRNFGKEAAMAAGLEAARGNAVLILDADLQHPPDLVPQMIGAWRAGHEVVNAVKRERGTESLLYRAFAGGFNRLMTAALGREMSGASDFKLLDRQVVDALLVCPERNRFFRGLVAWIGFTVKDIEFDVAERVGGTTKWSIRGLIRYSFANMLAFSSMPLRVVAYTGFLTAAFGFVLLAQTMIRYLLGSSAIGFTTVIAVQILLGGMILLAIGVVAMYLAHMYDEQKQRPLFLVRKAGSSQPVELLPAPDVPGSELRERVDLQQIRR